MVQRPGKIVNKRELAEFFGVSPQAIDGWLSRGCPFRKKGGPLVGYQFDTAAVAEWRSEQRVAEAIGSARPDNPEDAQNRKTSAEASLAELKLAREMGQLVALDDVEQVWMKLVASCRARILAVPTRVSALVMTAETVEEARSIIEGALHESLNELAADGISDDSSDSDVGAVPVGSTGTVDHQAAAEADGERVGGQESSAKPRGQRRARPVEHGKG